MKSNSLDIDFIHGDIHGRSCKKVTYNNMTVFIRDFGLKVKGQRK